jgi:hypothetical protein
MDRCLIEHFNRFMEPSVKTFARFFAETRVMAASRGL